MNLWDLVVELYSLLFGGCVQHNKWPNITLTLVCISALTFFWPSFFAPFCLMFGWFCSISQSWSLDFLYMRWEEVHWLYLIYADGVGINPQLRDGMIPLLFHNTSSSIMWLIRKLEWSTFSFLFFFFFFSFFSICTFLEDELWLIFQVVPVIFCWLCVRVMSIFC